MKTPGRIGSVILLALTAGCVYHHPREEIIVEDRPAPREVIVEDDVYYGGPPAAQIEVLPPRPYYDAVWIRGYWIREHRYHAWHWVPGHWR